VNPDAIAEPRAGENAVAAALAAATGRLERAAVEGARLDAELLMAAAADTSRAAVISGAAQIDATVMERFERMVTRREAREPLAYIVGHREFFSLEFEVCPGVLVPRPETETLVETALDFLNGRLSATILDIGTGSGAIAIAVAKNAPAARIVALDISKVSLEVAARNAERHRCADRITFLQGDCFPAFDAARELSPFDLIVSNPPYIAEAEFATLDPEVRDFEPRIALAGGRDGMDFYRKIAIGLPRWLKRGGEVMLEVGAGQADAVEALMRAAGCLASVRVHDLSGVERVVRAQYAP
jgi:release factor glutamine methyltransferase